MTFPTEASCIIVQNEDEAEKAEQTSACLAKCARKTPLVVWVPKWSSIKTLNSAKISAAKHVLGKVELCNRTMATTTREDLILEFILSRTSNTMWTIYTPGCIPMQSPQRIARITPSFAGMRKNLKQPHTPILMYWQGTHVLSPMDPLWDAFGYPSGPPQLLWTRAPEMILVTPPTTHKAKNKLKIIYRHIQTFCNTYPNRTAASIQPPDIFHVAWMLTFSTNNLIPGGRRSCITDSTNVPHASMIVHPESMQPLCVYGDLSKAMRSKWNHAFISPVFPSPLCLRYETPHPLPNMLESFATSEKNLPFSIQEITYRLRKNDLHRVWQFKSAFLLMIFWAAVYRKRDNTLPQRYRSFILRRDAYGVSPVTFNKIKRKSTLKKNNTPTHINKQKNNSLPT